MTPPIDSEEFARAERAIEFTFDRIRRCITGNFGDDHDPLGLADITAPTLRVMVGSLTSIVAGMLEVRPDPLAALAYLEQRAADDLADLSRRVAITIVALEDVDG